MVIPRYVIANVGDRVQFSCEVEEEVTWSFEDKILPPNALSGKISGTHIYWLTITYVQVYNEGTYRCCTVKDNIQYESDGQLSVVGMVNTLYISSRSETTLVVCTTNYPHNHS